MRHCLLFWRSFSHWVGGMGVLVFLLAIAAHGGRKAPGLYHAPACGRRARGPVVRQAGAHGCAAPAADPLHGLYVRPDRTANLIFHAARRNAGCLTALCTDLRHRGHRRLRRAQRQRGQLQPLSPKWVITVFMLSVRYELQRATICCSCGQWSGAVLRMTRSCAGLLRLS